MWLPFLVECLSYQCKKTFGIQRVAVFEGLCPFFFIPSGAHPFTNSYCISTAALPHFTRIIDLLSPSLILAPLPPPQQLLGEPPTFVLISSCSSNSSSSSKSSSSSSDDLELQASGSSTYSST